MFRTLSIPLIVLVLIALALCGVALAQTVTAVTSPPPDLQAQIEVYTKIVTGALTGLLVAVTSIVVLLQRLKVAGKALFAVMHGSEEALQPLKESDPQSYELAKGHIADRVGKAGPAAEALVDKLLDVIDPKKPEERKSPTKEIQAVDEEGNQPKGYAIHEAVCLVGLLAVIVLGVMIGCGSIPKEHLDSDAQFLDVIENEYMQMLQEKAAMRSKLNGATVTADTVEKRGDLFWAARYELGKQKKAQEKKENK